MPQNHLDALNLLMLLSIVWLEKLEQLVPVEEHVRNCQIQIRIQEWWAKHRLLVLGCNSRVVEAPLRIESASRLLYPLSLTFVLIILLPWEKRLHDIHFSSEKLPQGCSALFVFLPNHSQRPT